MSENPYRQVESQLRRGGLADEVATYVRDLILTGALKPGVKIDQDAVGNAIGVSRSPIREALVVLGQEGLLDVTPRRGAFVARLTPDHIIDHYELFGTVSGRAAAIAADNLKDEQLAELEEIHARFVDGAGEDLSALNNQFHRIINSAAPPRTRWLLRLLARSVPAAYYEFTDGWDAQAVNHHQEILEAILERDAEQARILMEDHLHEGGIAAVAALERQGFWNDPADSSNGAP
jgi:DNA-binding GntR family transcriptional regulator